MIAIVDETEQRARSSDKTGHGLPEASTAPEPEQVAERVQA